jgi:hypothetical protein
VRVTVWAVFQLAFVKVRLAGETVPSAVLLDDRPIVTLAVGCELSLIVNVAVPPSKRLSSSGCMPNLRPVWMSVSIDSGT